MEEGLKHELGACCGVRNNTLAIGELMVAVDLRGIVSEPCRRRELGGTLETQGGDDVLLG